MTIDDDDAGQLYSPGVRGHVTWAKVQTQTEEDNATRAFCTNNQFVINES